MMSGPKLLVTDLDGTLLGEDAALARFHAWWPAIQDRCQLIYATGRTVANVTELVRSGVLPAPRFVIGSVGTEIEEFADGVPVSTWDLPPERPFCALRVRETLRSFSHLSLQPEEFQNPRKVSFFGEHLSQAQLQAIHQALQAADLCFETLYSGQRYLDILPCGYNKGTAAVRVADYLAVPCSQILAAGDSGNDVPLYQQGFVGVIVANEWADLHSVQGPLIYRSPFSHADGVIDGYRHWSQSAAIHSQQEWNARSRASAVT